MATDWSNIPKANRVPLAAFFDLPRPVKNAVPCECGGERSPFSSSSCQRCFKRRAREAFVFKWEARFPDGPSAGEALADLILPQRNSPFLADDLNAALENDADVEAFRDAVGSNGGAAFLAARDERFAILPRPGNFINPRASRPQKRDVYSGKMMWKHPTLAVMRELERPRYSNGGWYDTGREWSDDDNRVLWQLCRGVAKLETAAASLGRRPSSVAHRARDTGLTLPLDWRLAIAVGSQIREPRRVLAYPFITKRRPEHELLLKVHAFIPRGVPGREDACQAVMLALLEGTITEDALVGTLGESNRRRFMKEMRRENFEKNGQGTISLYAPVSSEDSRTMMDSI